MQKYFYAWLGENANVSVHMHGDIGGWLLSFSLSACPHYSIYWFFNRGKEMRRLGCHARDSPAGVGATGIRYQLLPSVFPLLTGQSSHCHLLSVKSKLFCWLLLLSLALFSVSAHIYVYGRSRAKGCIAWKCSKRNGSKIKWKQKAGSATHSCSVSHPRPGQTPLSTGTYKNLRCSHICAHSHGGWTCRHPSLGKTWGGEQPITVKVS